MNKGEWVEGMVFVGGKSVGVIRGCLGGIGVGKVALEGL